MLVGPTAVGKTNLSLDVAHAYECEIISGDSMQVYRGMDIGTAKLPLEERRGYLIIFWISMIRIMPSPSPSSRNDAVI